MDELGTVNFPISCTPEAQAEFNHGAALLHSFWFGPAIKSFNAVTELDPTCTMGHWGVAMSLMGNPFTWPPSPKALEDGWAATEKAIAAGAKTPREQAYIDAITAFYQDVATIDHRTRAVAYEQAMATLATQFPEDTEATIFYALALNATALPTDKSYANPLKAAEMLDPIFAEQPNHPGVAHYLIHSYDYPAIAEQGLEAAQRYAGIAPDAPHALHMPSHIFTRRGLWQESIATNLDSARIANAEATAALGPGIGAASALHADDYLMYGYLQLAQDGAARKLLDELATIQKLDVENFVATFALASMPARYALERNQWAEAAALTLHPGVLAWENFPQSEAVLVFARGLGAARAGDVAAANQALERLHTLHTVLVEANNGYWAGQAEIQSAEVAAWIALAEGKQDEALALMQEAVTLEAATEKNPVTPGPLKPAQELLGEMLLELGEPALALQAFEASQQTEPNRFMGLYGAARAAELAGDTEKARSYYEQLVALGAMADSERAELVAAQAFLAQ
jgi:tetratricopeptide (TPR) repeat protein